LPREGIGWFTYEIFRRLAARQPEIEWIFIFDRPFDDQFITSENITPVVLAPPARHPFLWYTWFHISLPAKLQQLKPDIFISPDGYLPLKSNCPTLGVIHDLNFEHRPQNLPWLVRKYMLHFFPLYAKAATRLATVSKYSAKDISQLYGRPIEDIDLVYNGCGEFFFPIPANEQKLVKDELTDGKEYFLFVGALNPRKNLDGMLRAYRNYRESGGQNLFVIVGEAMFINQDIKSELDEHPYREDILLVGRMEGEQLNRILASSAALLFVSHFEGFGIPIVEAFKCQVPVITGTSTSMPEIAGDAAILCEPENYQQIAQAMHDVGVASVRNGLIAKGVERAKIFTWERSADMMWASIQKTLRQ